MSDLQKTRIYYVRLRACYRLPYPAQLYLNFAALRVRHEEINDMDVVPYVPPIPATPPTLVYEPIPAPASKEGLEPEKPIPEQ